ncbi:MAG: NAD(P)/FAD-dependent oxidoreductase [Rhodospirillaceae bacterium]|nr:NAD(P)/FAD-dependent oxidoreductase [Rhodospirillaceae bacterium]
MVDYDAIIIGAGAAGFMCAITASKRGRNILLLDHSDNIGEKIRISGGGRCNFTNLGAGPKNYISANPKFCISALKQFGPDKFVSMVESHNIEYFEKTMGQLFCTGSATQIIEMLMSECNDSGVVVRNPVKVEKIIKNDTAFSVKTDNGDFQTTSVVVATGGLSIPKIGASDFGHQIAREFGHDIIPTSPALVPFTFSGDALKSMSTLSGISVDATINCNGANFSDGLLFTHRGLSGPAILQISSYWSHGDEISIDLAPSIDVFAKLKLAKEKTPKQLPQTVLSGILSKRLLQGIIDEMGFNQTIGQTSDKNLQILADRINNWRVTPAGVEGYRTAEVTRGGVDTNGLSSKTMESEKVAGLFFIGEVVDVTGQLGGYNFQWAWSSGFVAGQYI